MESADPFSEWMDRLRRGDEAAAREVYARWTQQLIGLARRRLSRGFASREDPEDVIQSVYRSFFRRFQGGCYQVEDWFDVWALLARIALRKCAHRGHYHAAARRDYRREEPVPTLDQPRTEPTPHEAAVLVETVERLLRRLKPAEREIVELSLQGYSTHEISTQLERTERAVQRVREHVRQRLEARAQSMD